MPTSDSTIPVEGPMKKEAELRFLQTTLTLDQEARTKFSGYAAKYDSESQYMGFIEILRPGVFKKTLNENRNIVATYNHNPDSLLATIKAGTLRLENREDGLWFELDIPDTTVGRDTLALVERGDLFGCSFTMWVMKDEWRWDDQDVPIREITEAKLTEISIVINPAYLDTEVEARGMPEEIRKAVEARTTPGGGQPQEPDRALTLARAQVELFKLKFGI